jgi:hypothetical protein
MAIFLLNDSQFSEQTAQCDCGFNATRDQASALAMLVAGLRLSGREPA